MVGEVPFTIVAIIPFTDRQVKGFGWRRPGGPAPRKKTGEAENPCLNALSFRPRQWHTVLLAKIVENAILAVEVQADGLYEAAVLGLAAFKRHDFELSPQALPRGRTSSTIPQI